MILVGSCNSWGKDINSTRDLYTFTPVEGTQEYCLQLRLLTRHHLSFQIIGADSLWAWRLHPASNEKKAKELRRNVRADTQITLRSHETSVHGLNFRIREDPPVNVVIRVHLEDDSRATLWYERLESDAFFSGREALAPPWQSCEEVGSLRLVGSFCRRRKHAVGLVFEALREEAWEQQELCLRLRHQELKFQIVSDRLGGEWRVCPEACKQPCVLKCGEAIAVSPSRRGDGRGRRHFRIRESFLAVVLLSVRMDVLEGGAVGSVQVTYTLEERPPHVAIGPREVQFPPQEPTQTELMVAKIAQNPRILEVVKERLRAVVNVVRRELNTRVLPPPPPPDEAPPPQRVAAMLMLLPCSLAGWPGVFQTFLRYHLLAPEGPRFAHIFVFIDEPRFKDCAEEEEAAGRGEEEEDEDPTAGLSQWLEAEEAAALRPLVTLLDGSGPACLGAEVGLRKPELEAKIRAAALGGELVARQLLNMQRCLLLAQNRGLDWLLCNLDADEALFCPQHPLGALLAAVPPEIWQVHLVNHEAVLEEQATFNEDNSTNFFCNCTLFKRNPLLLMESRGRSEEQRRCMDFWGSRVAAAAAETQALIGDVTSPPLRPSDGYFSAYFIGKSAIRVGDCYGQQLVPAGPHDWPVHEQGTARLDPELAFLLHYVNCQGPAGLLQKYRARQEEQWNRIEFHGLCQRALAHDSCVLTELVQKCLVLRSGDAEELERQLEAGVCMRITGVRDAIAGLCS